MKRPDLIIAILIFSVVSAFSGTVVFQYREKLESSKLNAALNEKTDLVVHRNYTSALLKRIPQRGQNFRFGNLSANKLTVKEIIMPVPDEGNSIELYQPIVHGGNSITFKPYTTLAETVVFYFHSDGLYRNISSGSRIRKVVSW